MPVASAAISDGKLASKVIGKPDFTSNANVAPTQTELYGSVASIYDPVNKRLFVASNAYGSIYVYDADPGTLATFSEPAIAVIGQSSYTGQDCAISQTRFCTPARLAYDSTNKLLYAAIDQENRILVFDVDPGTLSEFDEPAMAVIGQADYVSFGFATTQTGLRLPTGIALHQASQLLYVADTDNSRVTVYDVNSLSTFSEPAIAAIGQADYTARVSSNSQSGLTTPVDVAIDPTDNRLFVTSWLSHRITVYDTNGLSTFSEPAMAVIGQSSYTGSASATTQTGLSRPYGLEYDDPHDRLFVAESLNNRVTVFDVATLSEFSEPAVNVLGQSLFTTNGSALTQGGFLNPLDVTYDTANERLFATDAGNSRVMVFEDMSPPTSINVTSPNGAENWVIGDLHTITWNSSGVGNVNIEILRNGAFGIPETLFSTTADDGSENWTVTGPITYDAFIRVSEATGGIPTDNSDNAFIISSFTAPSIRMKWTPYTGVTVANAGSPNTEKNTPLVIRTSDGNFIMVWADGRDYGTNNYDIYTEKFNASGVPQWNPLNPGLGIPIVTLSSSQRPASLIADNAGGAILAWEDFRIGSSQVFMQKIASTGTMAWTANGIDIGNGSEGSGPVLLTDTAGGAFVAFTAPQIGIGDIAATHVNTSGSVDVAWNTGGSGTFRVRNVTSTPVPNETGAQIVSDGSGGFIVVYSVDSNDIFATKVHSNGAPDVDLMYNDPVADNGSINETSPVAISDSNGGVIVAYSYVDPLLTNRGSSVKGQHLDSNGTKQWGTDGAMIAEGTTVAFGDPFSAENPLIISDNDTPSNGAIVAWNWVGGGIRVIGGSGEVYAAKVRPNGTVDWTSPVSNLTDGFWQYPTSMVSDGANGAIIAFTSETPDGGLNIMAENVNGDGVALWGTGGDNVETGSRYDTAATMTEDGDGGAVVVWTGARNATPIEGFAFNDIFAQDMRDICPPLPSNLIGPGGISSGSCAETNITAGGLTFLDIPDNTAFTSAENNTSLPSYNNASGINSSDFMIVSDLRDNPLSGFEVQLSATPFSTSNNLYYIPLQYIFTATSLPRVPGATDDETEGVEYAAGCSGPSNITGSVNLPEPVSLADYGTLSNYTTYGSNLGNGNITVPIVLTSAPAAARRCNIQQAISYALNLPAYITALGTNITPGTYSITFTYTLIAT